MRDNVIELADKLYFDLPVWKRWAVKKAFLSNNWDYTYEYEKCIDVARKMVENKEYKLKEWNFNPNDKIPNNTQ